ncbi:MAG: winged helix-turn-helix transcriptional regulator [Mucilaginibacter polytrichastri]|nr:winged helix-turn-helix transcriptional regulator [Mucilaginibacter polytrichastri]
MGLSKTELFTEEQNTIAGMAKALAHPARIAILQFLLKQNSCVCGDVVDELGLAQATTSQHLKELKKAGIVQGNVDGVNVCYCLDPVIWQKYHAFFTTFFSSSPSGTNCC